MEIAILFSQKILSLIVFLPKNIIAYLQPVNFCLVHNCPFQENYTIDVRSTQKLSFSLVLTRSRCFCSCFFFCLCFKKPAEASKDLKMFEVFVLPISTEKVSE